MSNKPIRVAVTGAAGQIGYSLLFRIASGEMLGKTQPVILQMLEIPDEKAQFTAMMRLDHNRAVSQIAQKIGKPLSSIRKVTIWGNHSATQYPDVFQAECGGQKVWPMINDTEWLEKIFIPTVQKRGAAIIEARGLSSAASEANTAIDHVRDSVHGTRAGNWVSMGVPSDVSYGIPEGGIYGYT